MTTLTVVQDKPLPVNYWAVICTILQVPEYQFVRDEARLAKSMAKKGLIAPRDNKQYSVTDYGQRCYAAEKLLANP